MNLQGEVLLMRIKKQLFENHVKTFKINEIIFQEGEPGAELYVIIDGAIEMQKSTQSSAKKAFITLTNGDIFGEMAIIEKQARSATAIAVKPTTLLVINEELFDQVIETNPDFSKKMIHILSERLKRANSLLQNIVETKKEQIVIKGLFDFAREFGTPTFKGYRLRHMRILV